MAPSIPKNKPVTVNLPTGEVLMSDNLKDPMIFHDKATAISWLRQNGYEGFVDEYIFNEIGDIY